MSQDAELRNVAQMGEAEIRQYMMDRVKEISEAVIRLSDKVEKIRDEVKEALDEYDEKFEQKVNGLNCRKHSMEISKLETSLSIIQDRASERRRIEKRRLKIIAGIGAALTAIAGAIAKYITGKTN